MLQMAHLMVLKTIYCTTTHSPTKGKTRVRSKKEKKKRGHTTERQQKNNCGDGMASWHGVITQPPLRSGASAAPLRWGARRPGGLRGASRTGTGPKADSPAGGAVLGDPPPPPRQLERAMRGHRPTLRGGARAPYISPTGATPGFRHRRGGSDTVVAGSPSPGGGFF